MCSVYRKEHCEVANKIIFLEKDFLPQNSGFGVWGMVKMKDTHKRWLISSEGDWTESATPTRREKHAENLHFSFWKLSEDKCPCCVVCFTVNLSWQCQADAASAPPTWKCWFCCCFQLIKLLTCLCLCPPTPSKYIFRSRFAAFLYLNANFWLILLFLF